MQMDSYHDIMETSEIPGYIEMVYETRHNSFIKVWQINRLQHIRYVQFREGKDKDSLVLSMNSSVVQSTCYLPWG